MADIHLGLCPPWAAEGSPTPTFDKTTAPAIPNHLAPPTLTAKNRSQGPAAATAPRDHCYRCPTHHARFLQFSLVHN